MVKGIRDGEASLTALAEWQATRANTFQTVPAGSSRAKGTTANWTVCVTSVFPNRHRSAFQCARDHRA